ncbi:MAG: HTH domain-containing protein, partial [Gammaproteobacteria bacterium]|nr:HTH domain-containing protein [Gammaproteobacteria bacterium]
MAADTKFKILTKLVDGNYHSGEDIGNALGISRAAVSVHIKSLIQLGLDIYSLTGKGYKLAEVLKLLDVEKIKSQLASDVPIELVQVTESTNVDLMAR